MPAQKEITAEDVYEKFQSGIYSATELIEIIAEYGEQEYIEGKKYTIEEINRKLISIL